MHTIRCKRSCCTLICLSNQFSWWRGPHHCASPSLLPWC